jgi:hypothetical protein
MTEGNQGNIVYFRDSSGTSGSALSFSSAAEYNLAYMIGHGALILREVTHYEQHLPALGELVDEFTPVQDVHPNDDVPTQAVMQLTEEGGSLDFLSDPREDVYTRNDIKVWYR